MAMPKKIDPKAQYRVTLTSKVQVAGGWLKPNQDRVLVKGSVLETIKENVSDAELVD
jgi:hypothetical protein